MANNDVCDVRADVPPGPNNPLPEYGVLKIKRYLTETNNDGGSGVGNKVDKRKTCRAEPLNPKCIPEDILLPSKPIPEHAGRFLETNPPRPSPAINWMKAMKIGNEKVQFPGWLIELSNPQLQSVVDVKDLLATGKPLCELLDPLYQAIMGMGSGITQEEVKEIMKRVPLFSKGWSFSHFMFIAGNPAYAKKKGIFQDPIFSDLSKCENGDEGNDTEYGSKSQTNASKSRQDVAAGTTSRSQTNTTVTTAGKNKSKTGVGGPSGSQTAASKSTMKNGTGTLSQSETDISKSKSKKEAGAPSQSQTTVSKSKSRQEVVDRLYQLPTLKKDTWPPKEDNKAAGDDTGYTLKQQIFYSGLLYCEMYDTIQEIGKLYSEGRNIPEPREKLLRRQQQTGFGASDIGIRKFGFAEWDRPLPPLPKVSPYIADFPLVGFRRKIIKPNGEVVLYKRSITSFRPLFLTIKAPQTAKDTIKVMADGARIKGILSLLASQGNCLALLPNVISILHLSDTLLQKMDEVRPHESKQKQMPRLSRGNESIWITKHAKELFKPHGLPPQIAKIPQLITFGDGMKLREICKQVREQHWAYICKQKELFCQRIWPLMHVERIPCGNLRESFVYSFQTLLPMKSHFPLLRNDALPW